MTPNPITRWRPRLTLRGMFALIAVLGCVMWVVMMVHNYRQEWRAVNYLNKEYRAFSGFAFWEIDNDQLPVLDASPLPRQIHRPLRVVSVTNKTVDESFWRALSDVKDLEYLSLHDCELQTAGDEFSRNGSLTHLTIFNTPLASHDIQAIGSHKAWQLLELSIVPDGAERIAPYLKDMHNLTSLRLRHSTISASALREICQARSLLYLDLGNATVDWSEVHLLSNLENLKVFNLRQSNIADDDLAVLVALPNLRTLSLGKTNITDQGIANLVNCHALESLLIDGTQITDQSMHHLAGLPRLESLDLTDTAVTSKSLEILVTSNSLKRNRLGIQRTAITEEEFDRFAEQSR